MVGRFESPELREEALAQEAFWARRGVGGWCGCLAGVCLAAAGLLAPAGARLPTVWSDLAAAAAAPWGAVASPGGGDGSSLHGGDSAMSISEPEYLYTPRNYVDIAPEEGGRRWRDRGGPDDDEEVPRPATDLSPVGLAVVTLGAQSGASEADTYATFGPQMRQWSAALLVRVHRLVLSPLLQSLDTSDLVWQQALAAQGWRLSTDPPAGLGLSQFGQGRALSVFSPQLPAPWCSDTDAQQRWKERQELEAYLRHPSFDAAAQRPYVLERLREWNRRGIYASMQPDWRPGPHLPTDAHILETLVLCTLSRSAADFPNRYLSFGRNQPRHFDVHHGQHPPAYLRQVADQSFVPVPAPHYEVVTGAKAWKLHQSSSNLTEALGLFFHFLRQQPQLYAEFPKELTEAVEAAVDPRPSEVARVVSAIVLVCFAWFALESASSSPALLVILALCAAAGWRLWWWLTLRADEWVKLWGYRAGLLMTSSGSMRMEQ